MDREIRQAFEGIKSLRIQGATAVAKFLIKSLSRYGDGIDTRNVSLWQRRCRKAANYLLAARPTEPLAQNGVDFIFSSLKKKKPVNVKQAKRIFKTAGLEFLSILKKAGELIIEEGEKIIRNDDDILTHCHSWLVEQILIKARKNGKKFRVYNTETRPLFQGRITARKLSGAGISTTMVTDSSAAFLISRYSGHDLMMDKIILGADAILRDGSVINKIGSFAIASAAYSEKKPLYIAAPLLKRRAHSWIKIERRSPREIWPNAPRDLRIINFAFDIIPAKYVTGIICEKGIIKPAEVSKYFKIIYPYL